MITYLERFLEAFKDQERFDIQSKEHIIAYIDLLGIAKTLNTSNDLVVNKLNNLYDTLLRFINQSDNCFGFINAKVKIFSDNIIIAQEVADNDTEEVTLNVIRLCSIFQFYAYTSYNWLLRGGVSCGRLYINDVFAIGTGLLSAYYLENNNAVYPRIIIDEKLMEFIGKNNLVYPDRVPKLLKDPDGFYFINYLGVYNKMSIKDGIIEHKNYCKHIITQECDLKILQKLNWQLSYLEKLEEWISANEQ